MARLFGWRGSPNFGYPRGTHGQLRPHRWNKLFHITGGGTLAGLDSWFNNPSASAAAHFGLDGTDIHQYVDTDDAGWHAGVLDQPDMSNEYVARFVNEGKNPNRYTVGIEVVALPGDTMTQGMWDNVVRLSKELDRIHPELADTPQGHLGHHDVDSVNRGRDPVSVYSPEEVYRRHHMAELTREQKVALTKSALLSNTLELEAFTTRMSLRDSGLLRLLRDGEFQDLANQADHLKTELVNDGVSTVRKLDALLAQLKFLGVRPR